MNPSQLTRAIYDLEAKWDAPMGGPSSRPWRELLAYCVGKLVMQHQADPQTVLNYAGEMLAMAAAFDAGGNGEAAAES